MCDKPQSGSDNEKREKNIDPVSEGGCQETTFSTICKELPW